MAAVIAALITLSICGTPLSSASVDVSDVVVYRSCHLIVYSYFPIAHCMAYLLVGVCNLIADKQKKD